MIDIHCHILPGIDDGAQTVEESAKMLGLQLAQGVDTVVLTPHYYSDREPIDAFLEKRNAAAETLKNEAVRTLLGAEVAYSAFLANAADLDRLCIEETRYILLELPFSRTWHSKMFENISLLASNNNVTFIIAHIELYPAFRKNFSYLKSLHEAHCLFQIDTESVLASGMLHKRFLKKLWKNNAFDLLASDCHNITDRAPDLKQGYAALRRLLGEEVADDIIKNSERLFKTKAVQ